MADAGRRKDQALYDDRAVHRFEGGRAKRKRDEEAAAVGHRASGQIYFTKSGEMVLLSAPESSTPPRRPSDFDSALRLLRSAGWLGGAHTAHEFLPAVRVD